MPLVAQRVCNTNTLNTTRSRTHRPMPTKPYNIIILVISRTQISQCHTVLNKQDLIVYEKNYQNWFINVECTAS